MSGCSIDIFKESLEKVTGNAAAYAETLKESKLFETLYHTRDHTKN
jgi:hypothetical protein